jgi:DNA-directed RNA polymerase specialized sigma subunit
MTEEQKQKIEKLRAKVAADPRTKEIAKNINMPVNDYAGLVAHFKVTGEEPQFMVVADEVLKKQGHNPPTYEKLKSFIASEQKIVDAVGGTSKFEAGPKKQPKPKPKPSK